MEKMYGKVLQLKKTKEKKRMKSVKIGGEGSLCKKNKGIKDGNQYN